MQFNELNVDEMYYTISQGFDVLTIWESDFRDLYNVKQLIKDKVSGK